MIQLEFRRPTGAGYDVAATLIVHEDGSHELTGDLELDVTTVSVMDRSRVGGRLHFADDPAAWARSAHKAFRSGYLVPVVVVDGAS